MLLRFRHLAIPYLLHGRLLHEGDAFLLLRLSFGLRSLRWRTDAKDIDMKMSVIQIVSLV